MYIIIITKGLKKINGFLLCHLRQTITTNLLLKMRIKLLSYELVNIIFYNPFLSIKL